MRTCADAYGQGVLGLGPDDVTFSSVKLHLAFGLGNSLYLPLAAGAISVLPAEPALPRVVRHVLRRFGVTVHFATPADLAGLLASGAGADELDALRLCVASGGP